MMHFEIQKTNLLTNEHETQFQDLDGPGNGIIKMYWRVFDKNSHIKVTCNNIIKEYFISPFTSFNECSFEFYNGTQLYKK